MATVSSARWDGLTFIEIGAVEGDTGFQLIGWSNLQKVRAANVGQKLGVAYALRERDCFDRHGRAVWWRL